MFCTNVQKPTEALLCVILGYINKPDLTCLSRESWARTAHLAFKEQCIVFCEGTCQCDMYFRSVSLGGSKYFHSETFKLTFSSLSPSFFPFLCHTCICLYVCVS